MRKEIEVDELWPLYTLRDARDDVFSEYIVDISEELIQEYERVCAAYHLTQKLLGDLFEKCRNEENKKYHELVESRKRSKVEICQYNEEDEQVCGNCQKKQLKGVYIGGQYIGCENCATIIPPATPLWPNLLEDSLRIRHLSQDSSGQLPFTM